VPKKCPEVIFFRIIGITLELIQDFGSARLGVTFKGFSVALFFMQVVSVSKKTANYNRFYLRYKNKNFGSIKCLSSPTMQC